MPEIRPSQLLGTKESRQALRDAAPDSVKLGKPRQARKFTSPPYPGRGNLPRYIKETLEDYAEYPGLKKKDRQQLRKVVQSTKALDEILRVVNKYYDDVGRCPNEQEIAFFAPYIAFRVGVR